MRDDNKLYREKRYVEVDVRFTPDEGAVLHLHDLRAEAESLA